MFIKNAHVLVTACDCNAIGSVVTDLCNVDTGQCQCKENFTGRTCDRCMVCNWLIFYISGI